MEPNDSYSDSIMSDLERFVQKVIPIAEERADELSPSRKKELPRLGWYFCLMGDCATRRSAHLIRAESDHFQHFGKNHRKKRKMVMEESNETQIMIIHNKTGTSEFDTDEEITPLIKLLKKWTEEKTQQAHELESQAASNQIHVKAGFVCLLGNCAFGKPSDKSNFREEVQNHIGEHHFQDQGQIFSIRLAYKEITKIGTSPEIHEGRTDAKESFEKTSEDKNGVEEIQKGPSGEKEIPDKNTCVECESEFNVWRIRNCPEHDEEEYDSCAFICQICGISRKTIMVREIGNKMDAMKCNGYPRFCPICKTDLDYDGHLHKVHGISLGEKSGQVSHSRNNF